MVLRRGIAGCQALTVRVEIVFYPAGHLAVCDRANYREDVIHDMLWKSARKLVSYAGEVVVPESNDAVWSHLTIHDSHWHFFGVFILFPTN